jgi:hypothetical protein
MTMEDILHTFFLALLAGGGLVSVVAAYIIIKLVTNPDLVEKWASIINKILADLGVLVNKTHRNYVKFDIQSRINLFTKELADKAPYLEDSSVKIEWIDAETDREAFLNNGNVVIRLRRNDPQDINFVHGAYWTVSAKLLPRVKRYISSTQKKAVDIYVAGRIIEKKDFHLREHFLENYVKPLVDKDEQVKHLFEQFISIDQAGAFYPVFLQELYFLGVKIYGGLQNERIIEEVRDMAEFLFRFATRKIGEETEGRFLGEFCKFGIVIVGTGEKMSLQGTSPYVKYINNTLLKQKVETIYILGKYEYHEFIDDVCGDLYENYDILKSHKYEAILTFEDGISITETAYLVVLRYLDAEMYQGQGIHGTR